MIIYKDIVKKLKDAGYNTTKLRDENILPQSVIQRIRENKPITTATLDKICAILNCNIEDVIEYRSDKK